MRLLGICTIEAANAYLDKTFLTLVNTRYTVKPSDPVNGHRPRPSDATLALVLAWQESRSVAKDWTIRWRNRRLQIEARHRALGLPGRRVMVVERHSRTLAICYKGRLLTFRDAPAPTTPVQQPRVLPHRLRVVYAPVADHPWCRSALGKRRSFRPPPTSSMAHSRGAENRPETATSNSVTTT